MKIAILKERRPHEVRVAATPETVKRLIALGGQVSVEAGAGLGASIPDAEYEAAGAALAGDMTAALDGAEIVLKVQRPLESGDEVDELAAIPKGAMLVALLDPLGQKKSAVAYAKRNINAFSRWNSYRASRGPNRWTC